MWTAFAAFCHFCTSMVPVPIHFHCMKKQLSRILLNVSFLVHGGQNTINVWGKKNIIIFLINI